MRFVKALIAFQLLVIVVVGVLCAVQLAFLSPIDEAAHFDYVRVVAEEHRLPVLGEDKTGLPVVALDAQLDPDSSPPPDVERSDGLAGESYEAFEPPLYYLLVAPAFAVTGDWTHRVKLVRLAGVVFLLAAAAVLYLLAGRAMPEARLVAFSVSLTVLMWPGVVVRSTTVSNAALELLACCAVVYALWRADEDRNERWLLLAGIVVGLALLVKFTLVALAPLLLGVAVRYAVRDGGRRARLVALAAILLPLVVMTPWLIFNLHHYDALTANELGKQLQEHVVNPTGREYTVRDFVNRVPEMLNGVLPQEWALVARTVPLMGMGFDYVRVALFGLPVLLLLVEPRRLLTRHAGLLLAPFLVALAMVGWVTLVENWPIGTSRRLYPETPTLALFTAVCCMWLFRSIRAAVALAATSSLVLVAAWAELAERHLL